MMSNPNLGPELSDPSDPESTESNRRGNPASAYLDETPARVIEAAQTRAATVSHRFGGARYALTRPGVPSASPPDVEEGGSGQGASNGADEAPDDTDATAGAGDATAGEASTDAADPEDNR
jgi:hypothetical protein